jgi:4-amino-4-deoxy-L-arabinose transferase-like glycosyltransferase
MLAEETQPTTAASTRRDTTILLLIALAFIVLHLATSSPYGFHRDELATLDDARHLDWGFVAYPPLTPAFGRLSLALFGISTLGARVFPILALAAAVVVSGLMARALGGSRRAQILAALAVAIVPIVAIQATVLQYVSFDYLWGTLLTYFLVRLFESGDRRWWLAVGAAIGLGMMTKYTMAFFVTGLVGAMLVTGIFDANIRRHLRSQWLWMGVALSLLIFLPNLIWQIRHDFISLTFLQHIHKRDVGQGRANGFLIEQLYICTCVMLAPLAAMGIGFYFSKRESKYRALGWMFVLTLLLFVIAQGRSYYLGPLYPMLLAAGCVAWERWLARRTAKSAGVIQRVTRIFVTIGAILSFALFTPVAPINSALWNVTTKLDYNFKEEIGWPELVATVADAYNAIPASERANAGILVGNYGEAGSINLFGSKYGLPSAISKTNTGWYRSYPANQPETLIAVGFDEDFLKENFERCEVVTHNSKPYGVLNEESRDHPDIYLCHHLLRGWPEFWNRSKWFG